MFFRLAPCVRIMRATTSGSENRTRMAIRSAKPWWKPQRVGLGIFADSVVGLQTRHDRVADLVGDDVVGKTCEDPLALQIAARGSG